MKIIRDVEIEEKELEFKLSRPPLNRTESL
jgi:hypothetical protein